LWDVILVTSQQCILLGISILPSPIPSDIGVSVAHGALKTILKEDPHFPLDDFNERLFIIHPDLKAHILVAFYHKGNHTFSYKTSGAFHLPFPSSEITRLNRGEEIRMESSSSSSCLTLICSDKE
jgi:hypothetical protein